MCNKITEIESEENEKIIKLESRDGQKDKNVKIKLTDFVTGIYKLEDRYKDLMEIASFVFAADRKANRGPNELVEAHSWSRNFEIHMGVRDLRFWLQGEIKEILNVLLKFISGDHNYEFNFYQADSELPYTLFDNDDFKVKPDNPLNVLLFSGGLDSLAGAIETLAKTSKDVCLVSHQTGHPTAQKTQDILYHELKNDYGDRVSHYKFECSLTKEQSKDESQRTRSFLYTSIAFAVAATNNEDTIYVFENGITSMNFPETQDLMNARASRTTHLKTLGLLENLFTKIRGEKFNIINDYLYKTKTDVVEVIKAHNKLDLLDSSVSCNVTRKKKKGFTHCGKCSQCIDRIFAVHATDVAKYDDSGIYEFRFYKEDLVEEFVIKGITDYLRLAQEFKNNNFNGFYVKFGNELIDIEPYIKGKDEEIRIKNVQKLCIRHAEQLDKAVKNMVINYTSAFEIKRPRSFYSLILDKRLYQKHRREIEKDPDGIEPEIIDEKEQKLRKFKRGELKRKLKTYAKEMELEKYESVPSSKVSLIARKLRKEGFDAKEGSISSVLRRMDYAYMPDDNR